MFSDLQRNPGLAFGDAGMPIEAGCELSLFKEREPLQVLKLGSFLSVSTSPCRHLGVQLCVWNLRSLDFCVNCSLCC